MIDVAFLSDTFLKLSAALPVTLGLFISTFLCGGVLAVGILALRMSRWRLLSAFARGYILKFRGSPLMIQLFLIYYGLGQFGVSLLAARCRSVPPPILQRFCVVHCWRCRQARWKRACRAACCGGGLSRR